MTWDLQTELLIDGVWVQIPGDVAYGSAVTITRGRADNDNRVQASTWAGVINDGVGPDGTRTPGQYNGRNPHSPYYGLIGTGTQLRHRVEGVVAAPSVRSVATSEDGGGTMSCDLPAGAVPGGDILVCFLTADSGVIDDTDLDTALDRGPQGGGRWNDLTRFDTTNLHTRVWWRECRADDPATFTFNGTSGTAAVIAIVAVQDAAGCPPVVALGATRSAVSTVDPLVSTPGITPDTTADLELRWVGAVDTAGSTTSWTSPATYTEEADLQSGTFATAVLASKQLSGHAATTALDFSATVSGGGTLDDQHPITISLAADSIRFHGEINVMAKRADSTGRAAFIAVNAAGILGRLTAVNTALRSPLYRAHIAAGPIAYWPGEDGSDATAAASAVIGVKPMDGSKRYSYAIADSFVTFGSAASRGSASLIDLRGGGALQGRVPTMGNDGTSQRFECVAQFTRGSGSSTNSDFVTFFTGEYEWTLTVDNAAIVLDVVRVSPADNPITITYSTAEIYDDQVHHYAVDVEYDPLLPGIVATLYLDGVQLDVDTWAAGTPEPIRDVIFNYRRGSGDTMPAVGHAAVYAPVPPFNTSTTAEAASGYVGETAADRVERLGREEGLVVRVVGDAGASAAMGTQRIATLVQLWDDAAAADQGILFEPREFPGLGYRTGKSLFNQQPVEISYAAAVSADLAEQLQPTEDDTDLYNATVISRIDGSSASAEQPAGRRGIAAVGRREEALTLNVHRDAQLANLATWRLHLGTWDEDRQAAIAVGLHRAPLVASTAETRAVIGLDIGDMSAVTDPPSWLPPEDIEGIVQGSTESQDQFLWTIAHNTTPAGHYRAYVMEDATLGRLHTGGSVLAEAVTSSATSLKIATTAGLPWSVADADDGFAVMLGGERVTVTDVADPTLSFVAAGTASHNTNGFTTPGAPAGRAAGDLLLMFAAGRGSANRVVTPVGYVRWPVFPLACNVQVFARVATNTSADLPTVYYTDTAATDTTSSQIAAFRSSIDMFYSAAACYVSSAECLNVSAQNITTPGLRKPLSDNCAVLALGWKADDWTSVATLGTFTEIGEPSTTLGDDQALVWDYKFQTSRLVTGTQGFAVTGGAAAISRGALLAFRSDVQTFSVTRAVNGVSKAQNAGADVTLYPSTVMAL